MNKDRMMEIGQAGIDRFLADAADEDGMEYLEMTAHDVSLDALVDAGVPLDEAKPVALELSMQFRS